MTLQWYLGWWNLIFILPLLLALLYVGIYAISGLTFGEADAGHDFDGHADFDADAHSDVDTDVHNLHAADHDASADVDHDVHGDAEHDTGQASGHGSGHVLSWLGLGRVPLSIVLMVLLISWGTIGLLVNLAMWPRVGAGPAVATFSLPAAIIGSLVFTRVISALVTRLLPTNETYVHRRHDLLGCTGEALFSIDNQFGMVSVRDADGDLFQVPCRIQDGQETISKGQRVRLIAYNGKQQIFYVTEHLTAAFTPYSGYPLSRGTGRGQG